MRHLTKEEIKILESQRCYADDWKNITIADDFDAKNIRNTSFRGHVQIGRGVTINDTKLIKGSGNSKPGVISVLNEGGDGNIVLLPNLTSQLAWMMIHYPVVFNMVYADAEKNTSSASCVIGDFAIIDGATKIEDCYINSSKEAPTVIGSDVIIKKTVTACGAEVTDAAKVYESFVGEAVHVGKGFSSEASVFFANAYMDNGEACAAVCGPFACSHHKSTLLIGGEFSFYNAGSNTNQSNHAYKMGPIHWGVLQRGAKTASGCHILWPATIGVFSMVMGKLTQHPDLSKLPFSYVFGDADKAYVYPGTNIKTVGTWRDINKWPTRDKRLEMGKKDMITFDFPNPYIMQFVAEGRKVLEQIRKEQGDKEEYLYEGCYIKKSALEKGVRYYDMILHLAPSYNENMPECVDMLGFVARKDDVEKIVKKVENGELANTDFLLAEISLLEMTKTPIDTNSEAYKEWLSMIELDARKEFDMGDVTEEQLEDFIKNMKWTTSVHLLHK